MKKIRGMVLAGAFLLVLSGSGFSQNRAAGHAGGDTAPDTAAGSCRTIAAILSVYPSLEVRTSEGSIRDDRDGTERPGCRIHASGPASGVDGEVPPEESIRFLLGESGWEEEFRHAADGPGTAFLALRRNGLFCTFRGGERASGETGKIVAAGRYESTAACFAVPKGEPKEPGR